MKKLLYPILSLTIIGLLCLSSCSQKEEVMLNIPTGSATRTLKDFARQANVEIVFDTESVIGVKTRAIHGKYEPLTALQYMLKNTPLSVEFDRETRTYAVVR